MWAGVDRIKKINKFEIQTGLQSPTHSVWPLWLLGPPPKGPHPSLPSAQRSKLEGRDSPQL